MKKCSIQWGVWLLGSFLIPITMAACIDPACAATVGLRSVGGGTQEGGRFNAELGDVLEFEIILTTGADEQLTGFSFFVSFDENIFRLVAPTESDDGVGETAFHPGNFLDGIVLSNNVEVLGEEVFLNYTEASSVSRKAVSGEGVAARFSVEVMRRPIGGVSTISLERRGHDRVSHYITNDSPGLEKFFIEPLGSMEIRVTGFRTLPLPDITVVEGEAKLVFDLDDFVDQESADVLWSSRLSGQVITIIDPESNTVTMTPRMGSFGEHATRESTIEMVFTAFEMSEGLTATDTIQVKVVSRPQIGELAKIVTFAEDEFHRVGDLDAFVKDLDDLADALTWIPVAGKNVNVQIEDSSRVATFTSSPNWFGEEEISITVHDDDGLTDSTTVLVIVTPVNDPPAARRNDTVYPVVDGDLVQVPLSLLFEDVDDDIESLELEINDHESHVSAVVNGSDLVISALDPGRAVIRIKARDFLGAEVEARQVAIGLAPGESVGPKIGMFPSLRFLRGEVGTLDLNVLVQDDQPVENLMWTVGANQSLNSTITEGVLVVSAITGFLGKSELSIMAEDEDGNQDSRNLVVSVLTPEDNLGPEITPPPAIGVFADKKANNWSETILELDDLVRDPDHRPDEINWEISVSQGIAANYYVDTRMVMLSASEDMTGTGSLTLTATDPDGQIDIGVISVLKLGKDSAPVMAEISTIVLDSLEASERIDLDAFVFDDVDFKSELLWIVDEAPGITVSLDPANHILLVRRTSDVEEPAPAVSSALKLQVVDTDGKLNTAIISVELPPLFQLSPIADVGFYSGANDTSIVLNDYVLRSNGRKFVVWSLSGQSSNLVTFIDENSSRVFIESRDSDFVGFESLTFIATDESGRSRTAVVGVSVKGRGLIPQIRKIGPLAIPAGTSTQIDLDDHVIDDDPDSMLQWTFGASADLEIEHDNVTNEIIITPSELSSGVHTIQFIVMDPAGNTGASVLEVKVVRSGEPPTIENLPQLLLQTAFDNEQKLSLDLYVSDADTPKEELQWKVTAEAGVGARVDGRALFISVSAGQKGLRTLMLTVWDPQGNEDQKKLSLLLQEDNDAPNFSVKIRRNSLIGDLIELVITPSEKLVKPPLVRMAGGVADVFPVPDDTAFVAAYTLPSIDGQQILSTSIEGFDPSGNHGVRNLDIAFRWMDNAGGTLASADDGRVIVNVPMLSSGVGRLAVIARLGAEDGLGNDEGRPIYFIDLASGERFEPLSLNFFVGQEATEEVGILRWDNYQNRWQQLDTIVDSKSGWLTSAIDRPGYFRTGTVSENLRRQSQKLASHPNPFVTRNSLYTQIEYEVLVPGPVELQVVNVLGQKTRILVAESFHDVGIWNVVWDGRDDRGNAVASGVYFCHLKEKVERRLLPLLVVR